VTSVNADRYQLADRNISRIGYGAMQLAGDGVFGPPRDRDEALAVLRDAVEAGGITLTQPSFTGPGWSTS
jgi:aryl-alcohol dehydrogenase-like predicted oxidoreductase